jgi:penicillin-binding protein 1A
MIDRLVAPDPDYAQPSRRPRGRGEEPRPARRKRGGGGRLLLYVLGTGLSLALVAGVAFAGFAFVYVVRVTEGLPAIEDLAQYEPPVMSRVHAGDGRLIAEYARESRVFVPIETIPHQVVDAFIAAEDKNFYQHGGIDPIGMARAGLRNIVGFMQGDEGPLQGGSTITQQVAKNFKLDADQTIERKVRELVLARRIEQAFTKDEILELYLNEIYLGRRAYGVAAAALLYFGKPLDELTLSEIAYLAAVPRAPNNYHPIRNRERAIERRNWVLDRMVANEMLDGAEAEIAKRDDLVVVDRLTGSAYQAAEYFVEETRRFAFSTYGDEELYDGGLSIRTTLDTRLQIAARRALRDGLEAYDRRHGYRGPIAQMEAGSGWLERLVNLESEAIDLDPTWAKAVVIAAGDQRVRIGFLDGSEGVIPLSELTWARRAREDRSLGPAIASAAQALAVGDVVYAAPLGADPESGAARDGEFSLRQVPAVNGAIVAIDPHTGRVLAMVGGYSFRLSQFNRVTQARRQPGSSFKPFVYAAALDNGYTPVSKILDAPYVSTAGEDGSFYKPTNYSGRWYGPSTLRRGIELSRNAMTVRLANAMGLDLMSQYGERFGIYDNLPAYESMSLGAGETTLWRMVAAYAELVNGGYRITPTIVDRVQDREGRTIYRHDGRACTNCTVNPDEVDWSSAPVPQLADPRERVIDPVTAYQVVSMLEGVVNRGTASSSVGVLDWPLAGKTGTTNDFKDAWFVGFSPDLVAGIYIGFDTPVSLGNSESGGVVAAPVFRDFMGAALADAPKTPFRTPPGVRLIPIDGETGALSRQGDPGMIWEAFRPGTEPTRFEQPDNEGFMPVLERPRGGISIQGPYETPAPTGRSNAVTPERGGGAPSATSGGLQGGGALGDGSTVSPSASLRTAAPIAREPVGAATAPGSAATGGAASGGGVFRASPETPPAGEPAEEGGLGALLDQLSTAGPSGAPAEDDEDGDESEENRGLSGLY